MANGRFVSYLRVSMATSTKQFVWMKCLLVTACIIFLVRGPIRAVRTGGRDFAAPYLAGLRFAHGANPYKSAHFLDEWRRAGASLSATENPSGERPVYPPSALIVMFPFTSLRWIAALTLYEVLCVVLYGGLLWVLAESVGDGWRTWPRVGFVSYGLALAPIQTGLALGNLSILVFLLCVFGLVLARNGRGSGAGILLAVSICLKPSVGAGLLIYFLLTRVWKAVGVGVVSSALISGAALLRMRTIPADWVADYKSNVAYLFGPEGAASYTNVSRFDLVNLQAPAFSLFANKTIANVIAWSVFGLLFAAWIWLIWRNRRLVEGWAAPGALSLIWLLPIYQRNYNAGFVLLALLWAFQHLRSALAKWILWAGVFFIIPGDGLLRTMQPRIPARIFTSRLFTGFMFGQASWAVLLIVLVLLKVMADRLLSLRAEPQGFLAVASTYDKGSYRTSQGLQRP